MLYEPGSAASDTAVALVFAGSLVRLASWVGLSGLFAMRQTSVIAVSELLSRRFLRRCWLSPATASRLELAGAMWLHRLLRVPLPNNVLALNGFSADMLTY